MIFHIALNRLKKLDVKVLFLLLHAMILPVDVIIRHLRVGLKKMVLLKTSILKQKEELTKITGGLAT